MNFKNKRLLKPLVAYITAAFVILEAVNLFMTNYGLNPKLLTLALILLIGGLVVFILWNWVGNKDTAGKTNWLLYGATVLITLFIGGYYWTKTSPEIDSSKATNPFLYSKLAVLPFENNSNDSSLVYLSDGIPENLINQLSRSTKLRVLSRNSTFILEESATDPSQLNKQLGTDLILTGRVSINKNRTEISCQLIDVNEIQIWGDKTYYDNDVTKVEEYFLRSILKTLPNSIKSGDARISSQNSLDKNAQAHYMKGRALSYGSTKEETEKALEHFRKAIELDPKFTLAYVAIANEKIVQALFSTATREEIFNEARMAVQTALALDANSSEAYYSDGAIKFYGDLDWEGAEKSYKKSVELNPQNVNSYIRYSAFLGAMRRHEEALLMANKAIELDPVSISSLHNLGWIQLLAGNDEQAENAFDEALALHPNWIWGYVKRAYARVFQEKYELAQSDVVKARELIGDWGSELLEASIIFVYTKSRNKQKSEELIEKFFHHVNENNYQDPYAVSWVYGLNGETDLAIDWAERTKKEKATSSYYILIDRFHEIEVNEHPRFIKLRKDLNFDYIIANQ
ncbi:MAG: hypothetical protein JXR07_12105 [Reichenbachiella sp.]